MFTTIVAFLVALGVLITFHELGHYWAARRCGVRVLRFSVGFGKPIWLRRDRQGTEWAVAAIPLGGFVKMLDDPAQGSRAGEAFNEQPVKNRFFIVAAGPIANFILAAVIYAGLSMIGSQEPAPLLAAPPAGSPAAQAGIQIQDRVISVDGHSVQSWPQVRWNLMDPSLNGGHVTLGLESDGRQFEREIVFPGIGRNVEAEKIDPLAIAGLSLLPGTVRLGSVQPNSPAEQAGLQDGDIVRAVGPIVNPDVLTFIDYVSKHPNQAISLRLQRDHAELTTQVTPALVNLEDGRTVGRLGIAVSQVVPMVTVDHGLFESLWLGVSRTAETAWFSLKMLGKMVVGDVSLKNLSGPVTIADYAGQTARIGWIAYLGFIALVSVSIGVLNLLPIPMLDGGHLAFYSIEILTGKPTPERWVEMGQRVGVTVLAGLMCLAIFNDLVRLLS